MTRAELEHLIADVPDLVRLSPAEAVVEAERRVRRRRVAGLGLAAALAGIIAVGVTTLAPDAAPDLTGTPPTPGATFVQAERTGETWRVERSDGSFVTIDPRIDVPEAPLGISPDGRWLSFVQGPEQGSIVTLYLLRSDATESREVTEVGGATWGFGHRWSPDSRTLLVPVVDGDVNVVDTDGRLLEHRGNVGEVAGFVDSDSLGWVRARGSYGDQGLTWVVTDLTTTTQGTVRLDVGPELLNPEGWPQLMTRQASLSPSGSRVAVLLSNHRDQARRLVFELDSGALIDREDTSSAATDLECPLRWDGDLPALTEAGQPCVVDRP
jgi:hypothetical protein